MLRWTLYILRRLANLLGDPLDATLRQVCEGGGRKDGRFDLLGRCGRGNDVFHHRTALEMDQRPGFVLGEVKEF